MTIGGSTLKYAALGLPAQGRLLRVASYSNAVWIGRTVVLRMAPPELAVLPEKVLFVAFSVVDEVGLNVHPILLGSGVPFFLDAGRRIPLELTECRQISGGCVYTTYRVCH